MNRTMIVGLTPGVWDAVKHFRVLDCGRAGVAQR